MTAVRKRQRAAQRSLFALRHRRLGLKFREIAFLLGVTKQRAQQIVIAGEKLDVHLIAKHAPATEPFAHAPITIHAFRFRYSGVTWPKGWPRIIPSEPLGFWPYY